MLRRTGMAESNLWLAGTLAGIAGAAAVNIAHETTRHLTSVAPRVDIVGMHAVRRIASGIGQPPPDHLRTVTFAADLVSNSMYYGLVALGGPRRAVATGAAIGALAGAGAVLLPPPLNLGDAEVRRTAATAALTFAMYFGGGLVAGLVYRALARPA